MLREGRLPLEAWVYVLQREFKRNSSQSSKTPHLCLRQAIILFVLFKGNFYSRSLLTDKFFISEKLNQSLTSDFCLNSTHQSWDLSGGRDYLGRDDVAEEVAQEVALAEEITSVIPSRLKTSPLLLPFPLVAIVGFL